MRNKIAYVATVDLVRFTRQYTRHIIGALAGGILIGAAFGTVIGSDAEKKKRDRKF